MVTLSDTLRKAIQESGLSMRRLSINTGINRLWLTRFLEGFQMTSDNIDKLADFFGLGLAHFGNEQNQYINIGRYVTLFFRKHARK